MVSLVPVSWQLRHDALGRRGHERKIRKRSGGTDETPSAHDGEVDDSIALLTKSIECCEAFYAEIAG